MHDALLLDRRSAAAALSVSERTLDRLIAAGALRPRRVFGRVLFSRAELERFSLAENSSASQEEPALV